MVRLKSGDILEIPLDEQKNKAYIVYIKKSIPFNYKLFGLCAIKPTVEGCDVEKIKSSSFLAKIMIFEDKNWKKIGAMMPNDNFRWPDFYENVLDELDKFRIYHWGEGDKEKVLRIVNGKDNLGSAQPGAVFYPEAALLYFREQLRKAMLYINRTPLSRHFKKKKKGFYSNIIKNNKDLPLKVLVIFLLL